MEYEYTQQDRERIKKRVWYFRIKLLADVLRTFAFDNKQIAISLYITLQGINYQNGFHYGRIAESTFDTFMYFIREELRLKEEIDFSTIREKFLANWNKHNEV